VPIPITAGGDGVGYLVHNGAEVRSQMRSGLLVGMAEAAGGVYVDGQAAPARLDQWYDEQVAEKPRREFQSVTNKELAPQYSYFRSARIVLLVFEMVMRSARGRTP
jgi:hypothetical protein